MRWNKVAVFSPSRNFVVQVVSERILRIPSFHKLIKKIISPDSVNNLTFRDIFNVLMWGLSLRTAFSLLYTAQRFRQSGGLEIVWQRVHCSLTSRRRTELTI